MKKKKRLKKSTSVGLVSILAVSNMFFASGATYAQSNEYASGVDKLYKNLQEPLKITEPDQAFKDNEKVRVIVELEGKPAISIANEKGVMYKDLKKSVKDELQQEIKEEQVEFLSEVKKENIDFEVENKFTTVMNGVSGEVEYGEIAEIEKLEGVESVSIATEYERPTVKPDMISSKDMVEAIQTWNAGYNGKGMVIGIIDTGIDSSHRDMKLTDTTGHKLSKNSVDNSVNTLKLPGQYYTLKVPYGYNYADKNKEIRDLGPDASMHGMHVAGTAGANGDENNNGIKGVAPEAQLLALKVFGNDPDFPSTFGDIYIKAIDDGIALGADVLNMSLGSTAGFVDDNELEQKAVERAVQNGVVMSISAGNSADFSYEIGENPLATNPDIGLVGSPSVSKNSFSVASIENNRISLDEMNVTIGNEILPIAYKKQSTPLPLTVFGNAEQNVVYVGDGSASGYVGKDVKGKIVLASRTATAPNYGQIQAQAELAGASGVIVKTLPSHGDYVSMALNSPTIPMVTMSQSDGNTLLTKILANKGEAKVKFTGKQLTVANAAAGTMATTTSWGVTSSLELKPEITAPGGQIYSTFNDDTYGLMSGTSMAAPHVAGGSALVLERVKELFPELSGIEKSKRAKTMIMNTAVPVQDPEADGVYYSPRRQGAGIMQLHSAVTTPVYVVRKGTNDAKVELKEITSDSFSFTLTATNTSDEDASYKVDTTVLSDAVNGGKLALKEQVLSKAKVTVDVPEFTLLGKSSKDITVRVDLKGAKAELENLMANGYFVEGFVKLINQKDQAFPDLSVPFVGFKGDWNKAPILDKTVYEEGTYIDAAGLVDQRGNYLGYNGISRDLDLEKVAISPNGDGLSEAIAPVASFLRNSKIVEYSIVDANGKHLKTLTTDKNQRKNYKAVPPFVPYVYKPSLTKWDGYVKNKKVEDGKYFYQIKTQVDFAGKEPQIVKYPVTVDTKAPTISQASYSAKNKILSFEATDALGSGLQYIQVFVNGTSVGYVDAKNRTTFKLEFNNLPSKPTFKLIATDYASNSSSVSVTGGSDDTIPYIVTTSPEAYGIYNTLEIPVAGSIKDASKVEYLKITADKLVGSVVTPELKYNATTKNYDFKAQLKFTEDGVHELYFEGLDAVGNKIEFRRPIFIDTTPATIEISGIPENNYVPATTATGTETQLVTTDEPPVTTETPTVEVPPVAEEPAPTPNASADPILKLKVTDNFDELRVRVDDSELLNQVFDEPFEMRHTTKEFDIPLSLDNGRNDIVFEVTDLGGHVTKKTVVIYKGVQPPTAVVTSYEFGPTNNVSTENPAIITAEASETTKWEAVVTDPEGKQVTLESAEGKNFTSTFVPDAFAPNGQYTLTFGPEGSGEKTIVPFTVENHPVSIESQTKDGKGQAIETITEDGVLSISANIFNRGIAKTDVQVIVQVKNANQEVVHFETISLAEFNSKAKGRYGIDIPLDGLEKGSYTAEVFVWSSLMNPTPLAETSNINFDLN